MLSVLLGDFRAIGRGCSQVRRRSRPWNRVGQYNCKEANAGDSMYLTIVFPRKSKPDKVKDSVYECSDARKGVNLTKEEN
jgi:hypothetical protein